MGWRKQMLHAISAWGLTELSQQSWVQILPCQNLWQIQASPLNLCSNSMFQVKFITKSVIRKWRANIGRFLFLLWNLTWNLKVKSKYMPLSFWRFPRLIFLLLCNKWLVQSFMWMQNNHDNEQTVDWSQKWEAEWNPNDTRTATVKAESKMNLIHLIPNLIFTYIWLQHLRQYYHYICC